METIKVVIENGKAKVEVDGCVDDSCQQITEAIEKALGTCKDKQFKPEAYQSGGQQQWQR